VYSLKVLVQEAGVLVPSPRGPANAVCTRTHPIHFDPADGGNMYPKNIGSTSHVHTVQGPKSRICVDVLYITLKRDVHVFPTLINAGYNISKDASVQVVQS
jgi:hypothetical protein